MNLKNYINKGTVGCLFTFISVSMPIYSQELQYGVRPQYLISLMADSEFELLSI